jgi:hypothetical protein
VLHEDSAIWKMVGLFATQNEVFESISEAVQAAGGRQTATKMNALEEEL